MIIGMISRVQILDELEQVRYYYSRKRDLFNSNLVGIFLPIVSKYDNAISGCSNIKLIDLYKLVYQENNTLSSACIIMGMCRKRITSLHTELIHFFEVVLQ